MGAGLTVDEIGVGVFINLPQAKRDLDELERRVDKAARAIGNSLNMGVAGGGGAGVGVGGGSGGGGSGHSGGGRGGILGLGRGFQHAVKIITGGAVAGAGLTFANAIFAANRGDAGGASAALERLPLGLGHLVTEAKQLWDNMTGTADAADRIAFSLEKGGHNAAGLTSLFKDLIVPGGPGGLRATSRTLMQQANQERLGGLGLTREQAQAKISADAESKAREIEAAFKETIQKALVDKDSVLFKEKANASEAYTQLGEQREKNAKLQQQLYEELEGRKVMGRDVIPFEGMRAGSLRKQLEEGGLRANELQAAADAAQAAMDQVVNTVGADRSQALNALASLVQQQLKNVGMSGGASKPILSYQTSLGAYKTGSGMQLATADEQKKTNTILANILKAAQSDSGIVAFGF